MYNLEGGDYPFGKKVSNPKPYWFKVIIVLLFTVFVITTITTTILIRTLEYKNKKGMPTCVAVNWVCFVISFGLLNRYVM